MKGLSRQFWMSVQEAHQLDFKFKVVKEFPESISTHAKELVCWSFTTDNPVMVIGFDGGQVRIDPVLVLVKLNEVGVFEEILVHNTVRAYILKRNCSSSDYANMLDIQLRGDCGLFHTNAVQNVIDEGV